MSDESLLDNLLDRWEQAAEEGREIQAEQLCQDHPDLLPRLQAQIEKLKAVSSKLEDWKTPEAGEPTVAHSRSTTTGQEGHSDVRLLTSFSQLRFLAKGGLGVVFEAEDDQLHRPVALKFMHRRLAGDQASQRRFLLEAEITGRLQHPGIVALHGLGQTTDGRPFYAMPRLDGETFQTAIERTHQQEPMWADGAVAVRRLLAHFVSVCRAIAYAHRRKVVHRDIKPANIMLGRFGETYVLDWGLAAPVQQRVSDGSEPEKSLVPVASQLDSDSDAGAGTPAFMSPEQAGGEEITSPATDIYSLGATLYKLLTGKTPFDGESLGQVRQSVIRGEFPRPSQVQRDLPPALEAICLKSMAVDPSDRYATAAELADELESFLADGSVDAYPEPLSQKLTRWGRRHRTIVRASAAGLVALLLVVLAFSGWLLDSAHRERAARQQGLRSRARLAANLLGYEIDRRWWELEAAARDRPIVQAMIQLQKNPEDQARLGEINEWLNGVASRSMQGSPAYAWFVNANNGRGTQIARYPYFQDADQTLPFGSIGGSYVHRGYFHGQGPAFSPSRLEEIQPIRHPHLASPFTGTNDRRLLLAFSVPIWAGTPGQGQPLAVLGMAVPLGELTRLDDELAEGQYLSLVYLKEDRLDGKNVRRGLVMHHSGFRSDDKYEPFWLEDPLLLRRLQNESVGATGEVLLPEYVDPLGRIRPAFRGPWIAACAYVQVRSRPDAVGNTGGIVILQERP